eukprot:TRINITY_DN17473_c0_g1_i1.p1 TRINITY_DN17473_c0_g1~~TRINITY_DN17473_c0_g1_i1.p1  ORF type:complete len:552 (+),score=96.69 TRINITY_DN17473_c0_g1_i1:78-1733(+)
MFSKLREICAKQCTSCAFTESLLLIDEGVRGKVMWEDCIVLYESIAIVLLKFLGEIPSTNCQSCSVRDKSTIEADGAELLQELLKINLNIQLDRGRAVEISDISLIYWLCEALEVHNEMFDYNSFHHKATTLLLAMDKDKAVIESKSVEKLTQEESKVYLNICRERLRKSKPTLDGSSLSAQIVITFIKEATNSSHIDSEYLGDAIPTILKVIDGSFNGTLKYDALLSLERIIAYSPSAELEWFVGIINNILQVNSRQATYDGNLLSLALKLRARLLIKTTQCGATEEGSNHNLTIKQRKMNQSFNKTAHSMKSSKASTDMIHDMIEELIQRIDLSVGGTGTQIRAHCINALKILINYLGPLAIRYSSKLIVTLSDCLAGAHSDIPTPLRANINDTQMSLDDTKLEEKFNADIRNILKQTISALECMECFLVCSVTFSPKIDPLLIALIRCYVAVHGFEKNKDTTESTTSYGCNDDTTVEMMKHCREIIRKCVGWMMVPKPEEMNKRRLKLHSTISKVHHERIDALFKGLTDEELHEGTQTIVKTRLMEDI